MIGRKFSDETKKSEAVRALGIERAHGSSHPILFVNMSKIVFKAIVTL